MATHTHDAAQWFLRAVSDTLQANNPDDDGVREVLASLAAQKTAASDFSPPKAVRLPACRLLPDAVAATLVNAPDVAASLAAIEDDLHWQQNPDYCDDASGQPGFTNNYAFANVIGPHGMYAGESLLLSVTIYGPGLHLPRHAHAASQLYWLMTGGSEWRVRDGAFEPREPGETVWVEPHVPHAMRTGAQPLLVVGFAAGDVHLPSVLV